MEKFIAEHESPLPLWGQVRRDLAKRIDDGEFEQGVRLPSEETLSVQYDVSRPTLKRVIEVLAADGYVDRRRTAGNYVRVRPRVRLDLDMRRPWKEQAGTTGNLGTSWLVAVARDVQAPGDLRRLFGQEAWDGKMTHYVHVELLDEMPIGVTESWTLDQDADQDDKQVRHAGGFLGVGFTDAVKSQYLVTPLDSPLIVVSTLIHTVEPFAPIEFARTFWLASRVRITYDRDAPAARMDASGLARPKR